MVNMKQIATAAAFMSLSGAMPTRRTKQTFIKQVANGKALSGPAAYAKALAKFGGDEHKIGQLQASGSSVTATPTANDEEYLCPVTIGSQTFHLDFDTGSSDLWVLGAGLQVTGQHTLYQPGSTAHLEPGESWSISYVDGSTASGDVYQDTVVIGETTVTRQAVERATAASSTFTSGEGDGLVGLAFDSLNTVRPNPASTFFTNAVSEGVPPQLTADLRKGEPGSYTFGDIPTSLISGNIAYTPIDNSQGFWMFTPDGYAVGDEPGYTNSLTGIADTGTSLILANEDIVVSYWFQVDSAQLTVQEQWIFDCNETLPDFTLSVAGYDAVVPGSYINYAENGDGTCYGGIQDASGINYNIYGDVFLKSQIVVFDKGNTQLGLAAKSGN